MKKTVVCFALSGLLFACKQPEPRNPVSYSSGTFIKESVQRNKNIVQDEDTIFEVSYKNLPMRRYVKIIDLY